MRLRTIFVLAVAMLTALSIVPVAAADTSKPGVHRENQWLLRDSLSGGPATTAFHYGRLLDLGVMCDWNGDGTRTPAAVRDRDGRLEWHIRNSNSGGSADVSFIYGRENDTPVCGDWNEDGNQTPGIVRERGDHRLEWHLRDALAGGAADHTFIYGRNFHPEEPILSSPLAGDWNADGRDTPGLAVGREDGRIEWHLRNAPAGGPADIHYVYYGGAIWGDHLAVQIPVVGDWNDDGHDTAGVVEGRNGGSYRWLLRNANAGGPADVEFFYGRHFDFPRVWE